MSSPLLRKSTTDEGESGIFENTFSIEEESGIQNQSIISKLKSEFESNTVPHDVTFIVNSGEKIGAHKFILSLSSNVFAKILCDSDFKNPFKFEGSPQVLKHLLRFMYTDERKAEELSVNLIVELIDVAKKFEVFEMTIFCLSELKKRITISNVISILETAEKNADEDLKLLTLDFIYRHADEVLGSEHFANISISMLATILKSDLVRAKELQIFQAVYSWAVAQSCQHNTHKNSHHTLRGILDPIISLIRFPLMSADDFLLHVGANNILTQKEICDVLQYISASDSLKNSFAPKLFSTKSRHFETQSTKKIFKSFTSSVIQEAITENGKELLLKQCVLDINSFISQIALLKRRVRKKIQSVSLEDVILGDERNPVMSIQSVARIPNLKRLSISVLKSDSCEVENLCELISSTFPKFLFVSKPTHQFGWPLMSLWQMDVDVFLSVEKTVIMKIDHEMGKVVINKVDNFDLILKGMADSEDIIHLSISFKSLEKSEKMSILPSLESVTTLILHDVYLIKQHQLQFFLQGFPRLYELVLFSRAYSEIELNSLLKINLCKLAISHTCIQTEGNESLMRFDNVKQLRLWNCLWNNLDISKVFPNLKEMSIYNNFWDKSLYSLLSSMLKSRTMEKIIVCGYLRGQDHSCISETEELFWKKLGLPKRDGNFYFVKTHQSQEWKVFELNNMQIMHQLYNEFRFGEFCDVDTFVKEYQ